MLVVRIAYRYSFCDWKRGYKGRRNIAIQEEEDAWAAASLASGIQPQASESPGRGNSFNRSLMFCNPNPVTHKRRVLPTENATSAAARQGISG